MKKLHIILVLLLLALVSPTFGQKMKGKSKKQLQSEITSLQNEISTANQLLKKTKKDREMTLNEVSILDSKIKQREKLIKAYNEQIAVLDEEIECGVLPAIRCPEHVPALVWVMSIPYRHPCF